MRLSQDIASYTDQMVSDCALDTASIFFYDETSGEAALTYLYHVGVSQEAQFSYLNGRIFESDPFTRSLLAGRLGHGGFLRWEDRALSRMADKVPDYRAFLFQHAVDVVGAFTRRLAPGLCLVIGTHCRRGVRHKEDVAVSLLEQRIGALSDMVTARLLEELLDREEGCIALRAALGEEDEAAPGPTRQLSPRETQIARLVSQGRQNKQIAHQTGLSQYTVENHLRRIYRKLEIHNRSALVAKVSRQLH